MRSHATRNPSCFEPKWQTWSSIWSLKNVKNLKNQMQDMFLPTLFWQQNRKRFWNEQHDLSVQLWSAVFHNWTDLAAHLQVLLAITEPLSKRFGAVTIHFKPIGSCSVPLPYATGLQKQLPAEPTAGNSTSNKLFFHRLRHPILLGIENSEGLFSIVSEQSELRFTQNYWVYGHEVAVMFECVIPTEQKVPVGQCCVQFPFSASARCSFYFNWILPSVKFSGPATTVWSRSHQAV